MKRFSAIEGLRGWLAWTVVISHIALVTDIYALGIGPFLMYKAGGMAVSMFIIISGFVITHLIVERPEPYRIYITRRFMRIFPLFAVMCFIAFFTNDIYAAALANLPWATDPNFAILKIASDVATSDHQFFWAHILAHLTMLHGAISSNILPFSNATFSGPAWSLSLEWQFYLIAPFIISLLTKQRSILWVSLIVAALELAYQAGLFGAFGSPSFLPGSAGYFAIGIASRLGFSYISGAIKYPSAIVALCLVMAPIDQDIIPILVWIIVMTGLSINSEHTAVASFSRSYQRALQSPIAIYLGSRSYSTYLSHSSVIALCLWLRMIVTPNASKTTTLIWLLASAIPLTAICSEILYRTIEHRGIKIGSAIAREMRPRATTELPSPIAPT